MHYYRIERHVSSWDDILLSNEDLWSAEDFNRLLRSAYIYALRRIGKDTDANHDALLPEFAVEFMRSYGFLRCDTAVETTEEVGGWRYPGKWLLISTDFTLRSPDPVRGTWKIEGIADSYEEALVLRNELQPWCWNEEFHFFDELKRKLSDPMLRVMSVPSEEDLWNTPAPCQTPVL